jgi:hypothetical protein
MAQVRANLPYGLAEEEEVKRAVAAARKKSLATGFLKGARWWALD